MRQPTYFIPHGAGPCFFMDWRPAGSWDKTAAWLKTLVSSLPEQPKAILVVSAEWEAPVFTVGSGARPRLIYDYHGFPAETYRLRYDAQGSPQLAARIRRLLLHAGLPAVEDPQRGYDHGVFIPLMLARPQADIPVVQLSLRDDLDALAHLAAGRVLAPLRDEGVLVIGSGMSWHNLRPTGSDAATSKAFDDWLSRILVDPAVRDDALVTWREAAPFARRAHPREEHLAPLFVAAGAATGEPGIHAFKDTIRNVLFSGFVFGQPIAPKSRDVFENEPRLAEARQVALPS
ncbi:MAG TPA: class III extradiol ring-cleavage dioxygenase [Caldimonas sp.]|nr:class III extradiol ring-cleavage dioxygenase [Caldimonas sp.]